MISGGDVDLFIETPVIFHELFAMIWIVIVEIFFICGWERVGF
jgi:hypothetical protein